jgi:outer membrane protein assembly factor BamE
MTAQPFRNHLIAVLALAATLWGCQKVPVLPGLTTYRIDIQQGNVVTQEMVAKLKPGMTRQQVRFVMGTPPIVDPFHADRWDYVYYLNKRGEIVEQRRLVLYFDGDLLKRVEGDVVAANGGSRASSTKPDTIAPSAGAKPQGKAADLKPQKPQEQAETRPTP